MSMVRRDSGTKTPLLQRVLEVRSVCAVWIGFNPTHRQSQYLSTAQPAAKEPKILPMIPLSLC